MHHMYFDPLDATHWKIKNEKFQDQEFRVAQYLSNKQSLEVWVRPVNDQITTRLIVPVIPNPLDDQEEIIITLEFNPPFQYDPSVFKLKLKVGNEYHYPSSVNISPIGSPINIYTTTFEFKEEFPETMELIFPKFHFNSKPPPLKYKFQDEKKYNLSSPVGSTI